MQVARFSKLARTKVTVASVTAREIIDSRGNPTVEATVKTSEGLYFTASVPSGASTGIHEAVELRDGGKRYLGKGVTKAVNNVQQHLSPALVASGLDVADQSGLDAVMLRVDGTANLGNMGANAVLGASLALSRAGAHARGVPLYEHYAYLSGNKTDKMHLPVPSLNVINGGSHAGNGLAIQEFMILPTGATSFKESMVMGCEVYQTLKSVIKKKYGPDATNVGDEGGFAPGVNNADETIDLLCTAIEKAGYTGKIRIGLDVAASEWWDNKAQKYNMNFKGDTPNWLSKEEMIAMWVKLANKYSIVSIEDAFDQDDFSSYTALTKAIGKDTQMVGDDLLVTNVSRVKMAADQKACNALLCKPNQIGSVTATIDAVNLCKSHGWGVMMSHRSGETEDNYIADMAVGLKCGQIKTGAPARSERLAKYNQLLRIEEQLGSRAVYSGLGFRFPQ
ncbi:phosphopyruvate hydratase [Batrachochytrium salamandrivorans]|nr:phosphopyruvate hydratase [Batrachochytrium salamandrivorans]